MNRCQKVIDLITPTLLGMGYELWGCEIEPQAARLVLRVYIDKKGGVTVEDCARVSRQLATVLAVGETPATRYLLEVSSPGMNRILFTLAQCERYLGQTIKVTMLHAIGDRKRFIGVLKKVAEHELHLSTEEGDMAMPWDDVAKASVVPVTSQPQPPKRMRKKAG